MHRGDLIRGRPGDAFVFPGKLTHLSYITSFFLQQQKSNSLTNYGQLLILIGSLLHRGRGNDGHTHRFFYYASYAVDVDGNTEDI